MLKKVVAVLFGGQSSEHEISCVSAAFVLENLDREKFEVLPIGINKKGEWFLFSRDVDDIKNKVWENHISNKKVILSPDSSHKGLLVFENNSCHMKNIDVVFPVLHGKNGEDGTIQGLLELSGIPFVGCRLAASNACMDKVISNIVFEHENIKQAKFVWFFDYEIEENIEDCVDKVEQKLNDYPVFVKPSSAGSSVGVSKAKNRCELKTALLKAKAEDNKILVEEAIVGIEAECAVLGNKNQLEVSTVGQIAPSNEFYDYEAKYKSDDSEISIPAKLSENTIENIRSTAEKAYKALACSGLSRVDFFVDKYDNIYLNEINTLPGFTSISMYPKLMLHKGYSSKELLTKLIELAFDM